MKRQLEQEIEIEIEKEKENGTTIQREHVIKIQYLDFGYPRGKEIFTNFDCTFQTNTIYGIVGQNGAGKTTLGKLILGLLKPNHGSVELNGVNIEELSQGEIGEKIGYVYQNPAKQLFASTVYEELAFPLLLQGQKEESVRERVEMQLQKFDLLHLQNQFPFYLSQGEKQRLVIAGILMGNPEFLVLDEPTTALDIIRKNELKEVLLELKKNYQLGILIISHDDVFLQELNAEIVRIEAPSRSQKQDNGKSENQQSDNEKSENQQSENQQFVKKKWKIQSVDPRTKLCIVAVFSTLGVVFRDVLILVCIAIMSLGLTLLFGVNLKRMWNKMKRFIKLLLGITILQSIFTFAGTPLIQVGGITLLTDYGIIQGLEFVLRVSIILMLGCVLSTSNQREVTQGLVQLKVPYEIAFMSTLGIRYLPIFSEEFVDSLNAILLRGIDIKHLKWKKKINLYTYIMTPVFVHSFFKAKDMAIAMELRGFRIHDHRTSFLTLHLQCVDYIMMIISAVLLVVSIGGGIVGGIL